MVKMISIKKRCSTVFYKFVDVFNAAAIPLIIGVIVLSFIMITDKYRIRMVELNVELNQIKQEITRLENINRKTNAEVCYLPEFMIK